MHNSGSDGRPQRNLCMSYGEVGIYARNRLKLKYTFIGNFTPRLAMSLPKTSGPLANPVVITHGNEAIARASLFGTW
jgi:hypothetical protein